MTHVPGLFATSSVNYMSGGREFHAYLMTDKGMTRANYMGPGTSVLERIRRGDAPVSGADKVAQAHDLRYTLANGDKAAERMADQKMISKLQDPKVDSMLNRAMGRVPIQAKVAAERMGIMQRGSFSKGPAINAEEKQLVETKLDELEMEGFGKPGARLRSLIRQRGGAGRLPPVPADLPIGISPETIAQIRNIAMSLNVPNRAEEWIKKQNLAAYYEYMGVPPDDASAAAFGSEQPWNGIVDQGQATAVETRAPKRRRVDMEDVEEDLDGYYQDYHHPVKAPRKRAGPTISKQAFLERMAEGRRKAAAKRKRGTTKKKPTKKPTKKSLTPTKRRALTKRARKMFKRMGRGLGLAGEGLKLAGEGFHLPDSVEDFSGLAKSVADHAQKHFRITVPPELIGSLGEEMSGMGADWASLESRLSGLKTL